jgi:hypothetical protein
MMFHPFSRFLIYLYSFKMLYWETGYKKLMCYSDSLHMMQLVINNISRFYHYANILELIEIILVIFIHHILLQGNLYADILAKRVSSSDHLVIF